MSSQAFADRLARALESTGLVQPVQSSFADNRVNVLCRLQAGNESKWVEVVKKILIAAEQERGAVHAWQTHICRNYFLKGDNLVFGWNISIQSQQMSSTLDVLSRLIRGEPIREKAPVEELEEFPLHAPANRGVPNEKGKGVRNIGKTEFHPARKS